MAPHTLTEVQIDGSMGEGGGQILRSSLALATCLRKSFRISDIRAARPRPGLQPQHLAAVKAAASISHARVQGDERGSQQLVFYPSSTVAGDYVFDIGTAGSTSLVLQTVLPALLFAGDTSSLRLIGGTHNPFAPPFDFLKYAFLPLLNRMGAKVRATLLRPGFAPKGGGELQVDIPPVASLQPLDICKRGKIIERCAEVMLAHLPEHIAQRELAVIRQELGFAENDLRFYPVHDAFGAGNVISAIIRSEAITECFSAFGQRGLPAEQVAAKVVEQVRRYLKSGVPVGRYLADQLLLPLSLAGGGRIVTLEPSSHTLTNINVIQAFMNIEIQTEQLGDDVWQISLSGESR